MVAISLYRGNLHRVPPTATRQWSPPPPAISLRHFRILTDRRSRALARLAEEKLKAEEGMGENGCPPSEDPRPPNTNAATDASVPAPPTATAPALGPTAAYDRLDSMGSSSQPEIREEEMLAAEAVIDGGEVVEESKGIGSASTPDSPDPRTDMDATAAAAEISTLLEGLTDEKEVDKKKELEVQLKVLNEKKHNLVQMLKQILNAEEEIKRRNIQQPSIQTSLPVETVVDMGSATRHVQRMSVDVNFGGELGGESDTAINHILIPQNLHPMQSTPPSATSFARPIHGSPQHSLVPNNARPQATPGRTTDGAGGSQTPIVPHNLHAHPINHHPAFSVPGTHFSPSTPSPAGSVASSVFRDSHHTSSL